MACPISIGDAQLVVQAAVTIYRKIKDAVDEIKQCGVVMEELDNRLGWLLKLVNNKLASVTNNQLDEHWNELLNRITQRMRKIKKVSQGVKKILQNYWENGTMAKYRFPFGKNPKVLRSLMEEIHLHEDALDKDLFSAALIPNQAGGANGSNAGILAPPPVPRPLSSPSPVPSKRSCGIVFVDPQNLGRSKVAEGYTKLLREWTTRTGGTWPVRFAHSAGMRVKNRSNCVEILQNLKPPIEMSQGNFSPIKIAVDSLLDNKYFNYPYKAAIEAEIATSRSRGINDTIFRIYDLIVVFTQREFTNLLALKKALIAAKGEEIAPKDKGRIVHLGAYISKDGNPISITDAKRGPDGEHVRAEWNKTTSQIKLAIKGFLKEELEWKQPAKAGTQS